MIELYRDLIIDHGVNPRNKYILQCFTHSAKGFNHFCGDNFILYLNIIDDIICDISFEGQGCSISMASASLMTLSLKNKSVEYAFKMFDYMRDVIKGNIKQDSQFYDINVLSNVKNFPSRVKCATLIWHTLNDALLYKGKS